MSKSWKIVERTSGGIVVCCDIHNASDERVASVNIRLSTDWEKNRHIIVAATDLLAALEAIQSAGNDFCGWHPKFAAAVEMSRAAIAKARGLT